MMAGMFTFEEEVEVEGKDGKRDIVKREKIVRTVFTDHSLFGFDDAVGILTNKLLAGALRNIDAVICVSHAGYVSNLNRDTGYCDGADDDPFIHSVGGKTQLFALNSTPA